MEVSVQRHAPLAFHPGNNPCTHWIGGCVSPGTGVDWDSKPEPANQKSSRYTNYAISDPTDI